VKVGDGINGSCFSFRLSSLRDNIPSSYPSLIESLIGAESYDGMDRIDDREDADAESRYDVLLLPGRGGVLPDEALDERLAERASIDSISGLFRRSRAALTPRIGASNSEVVTIGRRFRAGVSP
jgi:hypothetical protein